MGPRSFGRRIAYRLLPAPLYRGAQAWAAAVDIRNGRYYEPELDLIPLALGSGETAIDIGANFGLYSYYMDRSVSPGGRVYAFEPVAFTSKTLRLVARRLHFQNVTILAVGCSDRAGAIDFTVPAQAGGGIAAGLAHIAARDHNDPRQEWNRTRPQTCEVVAIDQVLPPLPTLSLIKCDIEGAELPALRGASRLIRATRPTVICEIDRNFLAGFGIRLADLLEFFFALEYLLFRYAGDHGRGRLHPATHADVEAGNFVFIHPTRLDRFRSVVG
ncbi:MAG TPA: FkbM family methyltransferase [Terriglobales bacterium]|nr:FkbM family methyltransferase [Terriglobales bacterium]